MKNVSRILKGNMGGNERVFLVLVVFVCFTCSFIFLCLFRCSPRTSCCRGLQPTAQGQNICHIICPLEYSYESCSFMASIGESAISIFSMLPGVNAGLLGVWPGVCFMIPRSEQPRPRWTWHRFLSIPKTSVYLSCGARVLSRDTTGLLRPW